MADFVLSSLRGGMNNSDPAISLPDDQCVLAQNVEFIASMLGERRKGTDGIDVAGSGIDGRDRVTYLYRHLPTTDETASELWAFGMTGTASGSLVRKTTVWGTVAMADAPTLTGTAPYRMCGQTLHGKKFLAYDSAVDRLHVWDGTSFRRTGLAEPAAPSCANSVAVGTYTGTRYARVRYVVMSGTTVLRRSEPSDATTFAPSGSNTGMVVTKPAAISEDETHWEVELSVDGSNFYRVSREAVATSTYTDTVSYSSGYAVATGAVLSEDIGDYTLVPSARYLTADEDRLVWGGSWEDESQASRVGWTPVKNADGAGNDERLELDTDPTLDLDGYEGGPLTGLSSPTAGSILAFKVSHIYKLVRSGKRTRAYEAIRLTDKRGALHGSVVEAFDQAGRPSVYFLDPAVGPCRYGTNGSERCGADIFESWKLRNLDAAKVVCTGLFYPDKQQVHWWVATGESDVPDLHIVLHTNLTRTGDEGARRGWAVWTGPSAGALAACLYADNIDAGTARNRTLVPFIGLEGGGLLHRCDTGDDDNGTEYSARVVTKPYAPANLLHEFKVMAGALLAKAVAGASVIVKASRDFGLETKTVTPDVSFTPTSTETQVIKVLDNLSFSELRTVQFEFVDPATPGPQWQLNQLVLREEKGQSG